MDMCMTKEYVQGSPEWLALRRNMIGSSDAPIVMNVSPYMTPYELFEHKLGYKVVEETFPMKRGRDMEPIARNRLSSILGMDLKPSVMFCSSNKFIMSSVDAINYEKSVLAEIKCPGLQDHEIAKNGKIPEKYFPQLQHQLMVSRYPRMYYFSYTPDDEVILEVEADSSYQKMLLEEEKKFYQCLRTLEAPPLSEKDYQEIDDPEWELLADQYIANKIQLNFAEKLDKSIREKLQRIANGKNSRGNGIKMTKIMRKGSIDYSKVPSLQEVNLELYRKENVVTWRISDE